MDMRELGLLAPTLFGLGGLYAEKLQRLKLPEVTAESGRIRCRAAPADVPWVNLNLRTGGRVLPVVDRYRAADLETLFEGCHALPWEGFIPREGVFPVEGYSLNSQPHAVPACQAMLKRAAAARLREKYRLGALPEGGVLYQVQFFIMQDEVTLMLDTTEAGLHKRGYRAVGVAAPLRGTLATAMMPLSRYRGRNPFCDPFCDSGTIAIEAAPTARNRAPGLNRAFSAQKWRWLDSGLWLRAAGGATGGKYDGAYDIWGGGIDPKTVAIARVNVERADVGDAVRFEVAGAAAFRWDAPYDRVVTNPSYGERILERQEAKELYRAFGRAVYTLPKGWWVSMLSSHTEFRRTFGCTADKRRKLYNDMLKCNLFQYGR